MAAAWFSNSELWWKVKKWPSFTIMRSVPLMIQKQILIQEQSLAAAWFSNSEYYYVGMLTIGSHYNPANSPFNDFKSKYWFKNRAWWQHGSQTLNYVGLLTIGSLRKLSPKYSALFRTISHKWQELLPSHIHLLPLLPPPPTSPPPLPFPLPSPSPLP